MGHLLGQQVLWVGWEPAERALLQGQEERPVVVLRPYGEGGPMPP